MTVAQVNYSTVTDGEVMQPPQKASLCLYIYLNVDTHSGQLQTQTHSNIITQDKSKERNAVRKKCDYGCVCFVPLQVEQNWATLQGGEMTIQTTQASEATQAVASLAEAAVAASQEIQPGATVTMALNR